MRCPRCGCQDDKVIDTRVFKDGDGVRRRRECLSCQHRYTTNEEIVTTDLRVIKKDASREDFDRLKISRGIENACYKRPVSSEKIEEITSRIISQLHREFDREVASAEIGNRVMNELRELDQVAYVRFASVYRKFDVVKEFIDEIDTLNKRSKK